MVDSELAQELFDHLRAGGQHSYLWQRLDETHKKTIWVEAGGSIAFAGGKGNVYWSVHPGTAARRSSGNRLTNAEITHVNCLYADMDMKLYGGDRQATIARIDGLWIPPDVVVDSGGGFHCYWMLPEPLELTNGVRDRVAAAQAAWVTWAGADPEAKDLARVLRVPGTLNLKYEPPRTVAFERYEETTHTFDELVAILPEGWNVPQPKEVAPLPSAEIGDAHGWFRDEAARLVMRGDPDAIILAGLRAINKELGTGIEDARLVRFIESARKKAGGEWAAPPPASPTDAQDGTTTPGLGYEHLDDAIRVHGYLKDLAYRDPRLGTWYVFDDRQGIWRTGLAADNVVSRFLRRVRDDVAGEAQTANGRRRASLQTHLVKHLRNIVWMRHVKEAHKNLDEVVLPHAVQFDSTPGLLKVGNGTLDLTTGMLREDRPVDYLTVKCPINWDPEARNRRWEEFVLWAMDGDEELADFVRRLAGYALLGTNPEQLMIILHGWGRNGKGTFLGVLANVMGEELAGTADKRLVMTTKDEAWVDAEHEQTLLIGRRLVWVGEPGPGDELKEGRVKAITGRTPLVARKKYENAREFVPQCVVILDTNSYPLIRSWDLAIRRRLLVVEFKRTCALEDVDVHLQDKIIAEGKEGILNWMVSGAVEVAATGLQPPAKVVEWTNEFAEGDDWRQRWREECTVEVADDDHASTLAQFHGALAAWWKENQSSRFAPSKRELSQVLKAAGYSLWQRKRGGTRAVVVRGLQVREEWAVKASASDEF